MRVRYKEEKRNLPADMLFKLGYFPTSKIDLIDGKEYTVYGVMIFKDVTNYLVIPYEAAWPNWFAAELFEITEKLLPAEWYFQYFGINHPSGYQFLMGYKEMTIDELHVIALINREQDAMEIFLKRKAEVDELEDILSRARKKS
jgi:hypothetical protein